MPAYQLLEVHAEIDKADVEGGVVSSANRACSRQKMLAAGDGPGLVEQRLAGKLQPNGFGAKQSPT